MLTQAWTFITTWYNLPFTFLLGMCLLLAAAQSSGFGGEHEQDGDSDADSGFDRDLDGDADADTDADSSADTEADSEADSDGEIANAATNPLAFLTHIGAGRAPLVVVLLILFGATGLGGWLLNGLVEYIFGAYPGIVLAGVMPLAFIAGGTASRRIATFIGSALPPISTAATRSQSLVGSSGIVISPFVGDGALDHEGLRQDARQPRIRPDRRLFQSRQ